MKPIENIGALTGVALAVHMALYPTAASAQTAAAAETPAAAAEMILEEVVVTAQRREENIQDVPLSISAITADGLEDGGVLDISRLKFLVPGMNFGQTGSYSHIAIRGARTESIQVNSQPIVSNYSDGIYRSGTEQFLGPMVDLNRVEVLRGPQGTLFGKNSYGGAIVLHTNKPHQEFDASLEYTGGDYSRSDFEGMINFPITDKISARIVGAHFEHDGYVENTVPGGADIDDQDADYVRGALLFEFDNASLILRGEYYDQDSNGSGDFAGSLAGSLGPTFGNGGGGGLGGDVFDIPTPDNTSSGCGSYSAVDQNLVIPDPGAVAPFTYANSTCAVPVPNDPYKISTDGLYFLDAEQDTWSAELNVDFDWASMKVLAAYTENDNFRGNDGDQGVHPTYLTGEIVTRETTQVEIHFVDNGGSDISWLVGAFYLEEENSDNFFFNSDPLGAAGGGFQFTCITDRRVDSDSVAVFGQVTFPVNDSTRITAGARYSHEEADWAINDEFVSAVGPIPRDVRDINLSTGEFAITGPDVLVDDTFEPFTWRLAVDHDISDNALIYGSIATGYSSGGFNSRQNPETGLFTYDESETTAYEVGYKATLLDGAMTLSAAAYYNDFDDYIAERSTVLPTGSVIVFASLGGSAESKGVDLEMDWIPTENMLVNLRASLMDTEYNSFITSLGGTLDAAGNQLEFITSVGTPDAPVGTQIPVIQLDGEQIAFSPDFTLGLTLAYDYHFGRSSTLTPLLQFYYSDDYQSSDQGYVHGKQDSYTQTDLRLTWASETDNGHFYVSGFVQNVEDEEVVTRSNIFGATLATQQFAPPKTYGVTVGYKYR